jgi:hypothetical protein
MKNIFLIDLEAVETRYTGQWKTHIPKLLQQAGHNVKIIAGPKNIPEATTPGAFLNFGGTNIYKASQIEKLGSLFCSGEVKPGDHFIFTDAWHPGIINLKYMSDLLQIPVTTHGLWHAGSYDPHDFLGQRIGTQDWVRHAEQSFFAGFDYNYFATKFHIDLICNNLLKVENKYIIDFLMERKKVIRTGWPMEYMEDTLTPYKNMPKRDLILFPHRIALEKQFDIFKDLAQSLPQYEFVICQEKQLTKHEYHKLLGQAKMVFSANLQETLGISCYEGAVVDAIPMVPDRLSYTEMYDDVFKYPSDWTIDFNSYIRKYKPALCNKIIDHMTNYTDRVPAIRQQSKDLHEQFFSATELLNNLSK